jgi:transposase InsO family protein
MNLHSHARSCPASRGLLAQRILDGMSVEEAAEQAGVSRRTAYKWLKRFRENGLAGLRDRSSRPHSSPSERGQPVEHLILALRRQRHTCTEIARRLRVSKSTVARVLQRLGLSRLKSLEPPAPPNRYVWEHAGDLLHLDVKKLGKFNVTGHRITGDQTKKSRGVGWEHVHVCIDDATRLAYVEILADEMGTTTVGFLQRALAWFESKGIRTKRVMSDNGVNYRSLVFRKACLDAGLRHLRTRPYTPRTNGKAERFIQTALREWAYGIAYPNSDYRRRHLAVWLRHYNGKRPHSGLGGRTPLEQLRSAA